MDVEAIVNIISEFCEKHKIDLEADDVGEVVYQNDEANIDAVDYFIRILEECQP